MIQSTSELVREFNTRARALGLDPKVLGDGNFQSSIAIVAEAPGEREIEMRTPLVGGSGRFLWERMQKLGYNRRDFYITNVIKRQVSFSKDADLKDAVSKGELNHWINMLQWELAQLPNIKVILVMGNYALNAITGYSGITSWRGSVIDALVGPTGGEVPRKKVRAVCMFNPAHVLREPKWEPIFGFDLHKFELVVQNKYEPYHIKAHIYPKFKEAVEFINELQFGGLPVSFDIETVSQETACIGFANNNHEGMCIAWRDQSDQIYTIEEERKLRRRIASFLVDPSVKLIAQNGSFDAGWLAFKDRMPVRKVWFDTLLAHHTLYPLLPHDLGFLTSQYTTHPYYKDERKEWREGGDISTFWEYNVKDCCITRKVHERLHHELRQQGLERFFFDHVMRLQPHLVRMQVLGIKIDTSLKQKINTELAEDLDKLLAEFHAKVQHVTGDPDYLPNPKSTKQMKELLFGRLKLIGRGTSVDKENRQRMMNHPRTPDGAKDILISADKYIKEQKFFSTYAESEIDDDGRMRCEYKQFGTQKAPGRLSSSATLWGSGQNLQNQPKRAYPMFIADDGYMFTYFDLKQAEAKIVSRIAPVPALIENFIKSEAEPDVYDLHRLNAAQIFKVPYDTVPKEDRGADGEPTMRFLGKRCVHGLNYRMGPDKLATVCNISIRQATEAYNAYHRAFPEIKEWWDRTTREVLRTRELWTPLGRRLRLHGRLDDDALESIVAFVPQSTIGDKVSRVIYLCHEDPEWPRDARIILNIHDALIAMHRPQDTATVTRIMVKHAQEPININGEAVIIFADVKHSRPGPDGIHRWSTIK